MQIQVSTLIVRFLERLGIETIFGIPGAHILPVYDALYDSSIESVLVKHEQAAAFMAGGLARATRGIGACITTAGPGATNLITGIANAYSDKLPVIAITGEAPTHVFGKGGLQESSGEGGSVDQVQLFAGITRYHKLVERTDYLANVLNQAARHLLDELPGPVVLSIPFNLQKELVDEELLDQVSFVSARASTLVTEAAISRCMALLRKAERPMVVAGYGCIQAGGGRDLRQFSEHMDLAVTSTLKAKGVIDERSRCSLGSLGVTSAGYALRYMREEADLIMLLGAGYNERTSYVWDNSLLQDKVIIQVDQDPHQLEKVYRADLAIQADLGAFLRAINAACQASGEPLQRGIDIPSYQQRTQQAIDAAGETIFDGRFGHVKSFYRWLEQRFDDGLVMFDDNIIFAQNFYRFSERDRFYPNAGVSSLGHAIPAAIGAAFKLKKPMFAVLGDGGFHMCCMEIMTAVNHNIPLNIILFNNSTMGLIRKNQDQQYAGRFIDCDFINPDYAALAQSFGISYQRIDGDSDWDALFRDTDFSGAINLIEISIEQDAYPNYSSRR